MGNTYSIGQQIVISVIFESTAGDRVDPVDVEIRVERPRNLGSTGSTNPTRLSTGYYEYRHVADTYGRHTYSVVSEGTYVAAGDSAFTVRPRETT